MIQGMFAYIGGLKMLLAESRLRSVLWQMIGVLLVLMLLLSAGAFWLSSTLMEQFIPTGDAWYITVLDWLVWLFSTLMAIVVGVLSYMTLASVIAAGWLDTLSARADGRKETEGAGGWWQQAGRSLGNIVMPLLQFLPYALGSLLLLLVPVIGAALASVLWAYAGLRLLGFEIMDAPASRRGWDWSQRKQELQQHRWFYIGFCGIAALMLMIPLLNLLVLPAAVVGLSRHYILRDE